MAFFCLSTRNAIIIMGVLNLMFGRLLVRDTLLWGLNCITTMQTLPETPSKEHDDNFFQKEAENETVFDSEIQPPPPHSFTNLHLTTLTTQTTIRICISTTLPTTTTCSIVLPTFGESHDEEEEDEGWLCNGFSGLYMNLIFLVGSTLCFFACLSCGMSALLSIVISRKFQKYFLRAALLTTASFLCGTLVVCLLLLFNGAHWIQLLPFFLWGTGVQGYFFTVLYEYLQSTETQMTLSSMMRRFEHLRD